MRNTGTIPFAFRRAYTSVSFVFHRRAMVSSPKPITFACRRTSGSPGAAAIVRSISVIFFRLSRNRAVIIVFWCTVSTDSPRRSSSVTANSVSARNSVT